MSLSVRPPIVLRVRHMQARARAAPPGRGRVVVFIGDGTSDRFAAAHADMVFAKGALARICAAEGWPFIEWADFADVDAEVERAFDDGRLPASADDSLAGAPRTRPRRGRSSAALRCGVRAGRRPAPARAEHALKG